ncbi:GDSL-type esterase/lipase family protein [Solimonas sp. SE-A11]|uniref:GDSL-type esterase/lipase family protein n=1 Tax=Solimonas sp. SE-A11 TaxID=3054954 RepID=UPI00259D241F|nr:GDSL-type esterase/lipase family protein [Solimonas sp. SE-A11]MDM4770380.1 GDSL-type esterase/lipase family protein [Solimonas sp. SE-A11]
MRQFITPHAGGTRLRLKLSNRLGAQPVELSRVTVGLRDRGPALHPESLRTLTFDGKPAIRLAPGETVTSDFVDLAVQPFDKLGISFTAASNLRNLPRHYQALEIPYLSLAGDAAFLPLPLEQASNWFLVSALEVQGGAARHTVVALGDSLTDGYVPAALCGGILGSPFVIGQDQRYPDYLQRRLFAAGRTQLSVVNAGIAGNRVNADGFSPEHGPALLSRLQQDVLDLPNVRTVILLQGINDLGLQLAPSAEPLIAGLSAAVSQLKAGGVRVVLGTITPGRGFCTGPLSALDPLTPGVLSGSAAVDGARQQVNQWIRGGASGADAVLDADACLRDPLNPSYLARAYDSGDHLHPNVSGYEALAGCVALEAL